MGRLRSDAEIDLAAVAQISIRRGELELLSFDDAVDNQLHESLGTNYKAMVVLLETTQVGRCVGVS